MGRRRLVQVLAACGTLLLVGQVVLLRLLSGGRPEASPGGEATAAALNLLLNATAGVGVAVVVVDARVLQRLDAECPLCVERPVAVGALFRGRARDTQRLQAHLDAAGFRSALLLNTLPPEPKAPLAVRDLPTALLISKDAQVRAAI
jgi:hypothetical protein